MSQVNARKDHSLNKLEIKNFTSYPIAVPLLGLLVNRTVISAGIWCIWTMTLIQIVVNIFNFVKRNANIN
jgi:uncharacterized membrane protein